MAAAITIDDGTNPPVTGKLTQPFVWLNVVHTFSNFDDTGVLGWEWTLLDKPIGSGASVATPFASTMTITPDVPGTYLVRLRTYTDAGRATLDAEDQTFLAVLFDGTFDWRVPAAGETDEDSATRGWATAREDAIRDLQAYATGGLQTAFDEVQLIDLSGLTFDLQASAVSQLAVAPTGASIQLQDGIDATPSLRFASDVDTGLRYQSGTVRGGVFVAEGSAVARFVYDAGAGARQIRAAIGGSSTRPAFSFDGGEGSGMYLSSGNPAISASTSAAVVFTPSAVTPFGASYDLGSITSPFDRLILNNGTAADPAIYWDGLDHGFYVEATESAIAYARGNLPKVYISQSIVRPADNTVVDLGAPDSGVIKGWSRLLTRDGSTSAPAITFSADTDTGLWRNASDVLGVAVGGGKYVFTTTYLAPITGFGGALDLGNTANSWGQIFMANGSAGTPSFTWASSPTTGFYRAAADHIGVSLAGTVRTSWITSGFYAEDAAYTLGIASKPWAQLIVASGNAAAPSIRLNETDLGFYRAAADQIGFASQGAQAFIIREQGRTAASGNHVFVEATPTAANISGTGSWEGLGLTVASDGAGSGGWNLLRGDVTTATATGTKRLIKMSVDATPVWEVDDTGTLVTGIVPSGSMSFPLLAPDGSVGVPSYSWANDTGMGFYRFSAGNMAFAVSGAAVFRFNSSGVLPATDLGATSGTSARRWSVSYHGAGSAAAPSVSVGTSNTGLWQTSNALGITAAGNNIAYFNWTAGGSHAQILAADFGDVSRPTYSFNTRGNHGLWSPSNGSVQLTADGAGGFKVWDGLATNGGGIHVFSEIIADASALATAGDGYTGLQIGITDYVPNADGPREFLNARLSGESRIRLNMDGDNAEVEAERGLLQTFHSVIESAGGTNLFAAPGSETWSASLGTPTITTGISDPFGGTSAITVQDNDGAQYEIAVNDTKATPTSTEPFWWAWAVKQQDSPGFFTEVQLYEGATVRAGVSLDIETGAWQIRVGSISVGNLNGEIELVNGWWFFTARIAAGQFTGGTANLETRVHGALGTTYATPATGATGTTTFYGPYFADAEVAANNPRKALAALRSDQLRLPPGTAGAPSLSVQYGDGQENIDLSTGLYGPASTAVAVVGDGQEIVRFQAPGGVKQAVFAAGAVGSPSMSFTGDLNTGFYSPAADQVALSLAGTERVLWTGTNMTVSQNIVPSPSATRTLGTTSSSWSGIYMAPGTAALPSYSFAADSNSGFFNVADTSIGVSINAGEVARFNSLGMVLQGTGALQWDGDSDTFIARVSANLFQLRAGANSIFVDGVNEQFRPDADSWTLGSATDRWGRLSLIGQSAAAPAVAIRDADSGIYSAVTDQIAVACGGIEVAQFVAPAGANPQIVAPSGSSTAPGIVFAGEGGSPRNTGWYHYAENVWAFTSAGSAKCVLNTSGIEPEADNGYNLGWTDKRWAGLYLVAGSAANPAVSISFNTTSTDNGLYAPAADELALALAGVQRMRWAGTVATLTMSLDPGAANTYDLGDAGAVWRSGYFGTAVFTPEVLAEAAGAALTVQGRVTTGSAEAALILTNQNDFTASAGTQTGVGISYTLNQTGTADFTALNIDVTDTASPNPGFLINAAWGGTNRFQVAEDGVVTVGADGSAAAPAVGVGGASQGIFRAAAAQLGLAANSEAVIVDNAGAIPVFRPDVDSTWDLGDNTRRFRVTWTDAVVCGPGDATNAAIEIDTVGMYQIASNQLGFAVGNVLRLELNANNLILRTITGGAFHHATNDDSDLGTSSLKWRRLYVGPGALATPSVVVSDSDVGLWHPTADVLGLAAGGTTGIRLYGSTVQEVRPEEDNEWTLGTQSLRFEDIHVTKTTIGDVNNTRAQQETGYVQTTNATTTTVYTSPTALTVGFTVHVTATQVGSPFDQQFFRVVGSRHDGDNSTVSGTVEKGGDAGGSGWSIEVDENADSFRVRVTGEASHTIDWYCYVTHYGS